MTPRVTMHFLLILSVLGAAPAALGGPKGDRSTAAGEKAPVQVRVARALYPRERWRRAVKDASDQMAARIAERGTGYFELSPEFSDRLRQEYEAMMPYEELVGYQARILSSTFSQEELNRMLTFFRSPTGQNSIRFLNELVRDADNQLQMALLQRLPRALERLRPLVRQLSPDDETAEPSGGWE